MRKQEKGVWGGGILADEMGYVQTEIRSNMPLLTWLALSGVIEYLRMGKTVQMLGLLSADRRKPNLIVA